MLIDQLQKSTGPSIYYDPSFRNTLEDHLTYLRQSKETNILTISPFHAIKYKGDLFGLLIQYGVPNEYHWLVMRINNMVSPTDIDEKISTLSVPSYSLVERIRSTYVTQNKNKI